ncbi:WhiB family transcriptional regulator (plasmid) [Pseudonocardia sp. DSM 110487]|nr:WhiB family transcriptional regulator [Pseudonocardia sp. DSM 110487]
MNWRLLAKCGDVDDPELFFPVAQPGTEPYARQVAKAKAVCAACPVRAKCLEYALPRDVVGVFGGHDEFERQELRRATRDRGGRRASQPEPARRPPAAELELAIRPDAPRAERIAVAVALTNSGERAASVATRLGVSERTVLRWCSAQRGRVTAA